MLHDQITVAAVALVVLLALESWRRSMRERAPHWVHVVAVLLSVEVVVGVIYAEYQLYQAVAHLQTGAAAEKATMLANDISIAMRSNAIAILGVILEIIVLVIGTVLARRHTDAPVARAR